MLIRAAAFSFILFDSSSETSRNCVTAILKLVLQYYSGAIIARYDAILNQSLCMYLYNHLIILNININWVYVCCIVGIVYSC